MLLTVLRAHLRCQGQLAAQTALSWRAGSSNRPPRPLPVVVLRWTPPWPRRPHHGGGRASTLVLLFLHRRVLFALFPVWGVARWRLLGAGIGLMACRPTGLSVLVGASALVASVSRSVCTPVPRLLSHVSNNFHPPDAHCPPHPTPSGDPQYPLRRQILCAPPCEEQMVIDKASDRRDPPRA